jgi:hypothetical protein
VWKQCGA